MPEIRRSKGDPGAAGVDAIALTHTAAWFAANNPIVVAGRFAFESDTSVLKMGDGVKAYADLTPVDVAGKTLLEVTLAATSAAFTALADVPGLALDVPDYPYPVDLWFHTSNLYNDVGMTAPGGVVTSGITLVSIVATTGLILKSLDRHVQPFTAGANGGKQSNMFASLPAHSPGNYRVRGQRVNAGNSFVYATADDKAWFRALGR